MSREAPSFDDTKRLALLSEGIGYFAVIDEPRQGWQGYVILPDTMIGVEDHIQQFRTYFESKGDTLTTAETSLMSTMIGEGFPGLRDEDRGMIGNFISTLAMAHRDKKHGVLTACAAMISHLTGHRFFVVTLHSARAGGTRTGYDYTDNTMVELAAAASGISVADAMSRIVCGRPDVVAMTGKPAIPQRLSHGPGKRKKKRK
jgi:hypothetical protein